MAVLAAPFVVLAGNSPALKLVQEASALIESSQASDLDRKEGFRKLQEAIKADPELAWARYVLARYYASSGRLRSGYAIADTYDADALKKALDSLEEAIRIRPDYVDAHVYKGYLLAHGGKYGKAHAAFARAHELIGTDDWLDVDEADLAWMEGRYGDAKKLLDTFLAREPGRGRPRWYADHFYVRVACALGDPQLARGAFDRFARDYPSDPWVFGDYAYNLMWYLGDFKNAEKAARDALAIRESGDMKQTLALALYGQWAVLVGHDNARAMALLDEADRLYPAMLVGRSEALKRPTLQPILAALKEQGLYDENDGVGMRVLRQTWSFTARKAGIAQWSPWLWLRIALAVTLSIWLRRRLKERRLARAATVGQAVQSGSGPLVSVPSTQVTHTSGVESFRFTGSGAEYFRIWIVNLLLTIVTLGVYSAWAKVRKLKYFYRHTELAGARFDYHGDPIAILKGRIVAVVLVLAYKYLFDFTSPTGIATGVLLAAVLPWLLRNSLRFRLRNSSYRGLRFAFKGSLPLAYYVFGVGAVGTLATGYLLAPFFHQRLKAYQHGNMLHGQTRFSFDATPGQFYSVYLRGSAVLFGLIVTGVLVPVLLAAQHKAVAPGTGQLIAVGIVATYLLAILLAAPYFSARLQNLIWNRTRFGGHVFNSTLSVRRLFWIYAANLLGVVLTLGFFMPWASMRLARYKAQSLTVSGTDALGSVQAGEAESPSASGQETADLFDIDIAL